ncbi:MAG: ATP-dependent DNA ligase [Actinomycetales bacterium]
MLPFSPPLAPMLAKSVPNLPTGDLLYEPKWDGFRALVWRDGDDVVITSRGEKPMTRYFPDVVEAALASLPERCVTDGEIIVRRPTDDGRERLDWEALAQRIHPAESRVRRLAAETPASYVAFDLLALGDEDLRSQPFAERRQRLVAVLASAAPPIHVTAATEDVELARQWFEVFEGAGLDGVVAKPTDLRYQPDKRAMFKVKHSRTADCVVVGYRMHKSGQGVGSLLLGLYDGDQLRQVGGIAAMPTKRRVELIDELAPYLQRDDSGEVRTAEGEKSRFTGARDMTWYPLRPELVVEVRYDQMEGDRFRHTVQLERWRPDRDPRSCTFDQLDRPIAYDLGDVLAE